MNKREFYFTHSLTESEHDIVKLQLEQECQKRGLTLQYYRKFKTGHIPSQREVKILGDMGQILKLLKEMDLHYGNFWRDSLCPKCSAPKSNERTK